MVRLFKVRHTLVAKSKVRLPEFAGPDLSLSPRRGFQIGVNMSSADGGEATARASQGVVEASGRSSTVAAQGGGETADAPGGDRD